MGGGEELWRFWSLHVERQQFLPQSQERKPDQDRARRALDDEEPTRKVWAKLRRARSADRISHRAAARKANAAWLPQATTKTRTNQRLSYPQATIVG